MSSCGALHPHQPLLRGGSWPLRSPAASCASSSFPLSGHGFRGREYEQYHPHIPFRCISMSRTQIQECEGVFHNGVSTKRWKEIVADDRECGADFEGIIKEHVKFVKSMLKSIEDGEISVSAYDTAWVAMVQDVYGRRNTPQFPAAIWWIAENQLPDGSWGDSRVFSAHDRLINTLACVVALKLWDVHRGKFERGVRFFRENIAKLGDEEDERMPIGFEVAFPSLLELARGLGIDAPYDSPVLQKIYAMKNLKLTRIPREIMHNVATTLLHSLEGMSGLEWDRLLKLKCNDGSFLFSPSATAFALMQTKDESCLRYLHSMLNRFHGGVPNVYPVDLFERIWAVDRLQRLGISRYFKEEIRGCLDYVYRHWTEKGICWARDSSVQDIDDTAMGFRLLRLHGYGVSADVFGNFEKGGEFFCFAWQSNQAVTGIFNLYRASQVSFPGEKVLQDAHRFSYRFLRKKQQANELIDKWIIAKDLPGEVGCALDIPWYASLPRLETRFFIEQYGGEDDVWIGKTLYRMPKVNNNVYLELGKLDYHRCQAIHQMEWENLQKWYEDWGLDEYGVSRGDVILCYFIGAASVYEPGKSRERLAWAKTSVMIETIASYYEGSSGDSRRRFFDTFTKSTSPRVYVNGRMKVGRKGTRLIKILLGTLNQLALDILVAYGRDISHSLYNAWGKWLGKWKESGERREGEPELVVEMISLSSLSDSGKNWVNVRDDCSSISHLFNLTNKICVQLAPYLSQKTKAHNFGFRKCRGGETVQKLGVEADMQELAELVFKTSSNNITSEMKQIFWAVARGFYYTAFFDKETIYSHIAKVLFERFD